MAKFVGSDLDFGNAARVRNLAQPVLDADAATKGYVDSAVEGLAWKDSVRVASSANVNLAAPGAAIDGINLVANDRVLLRAQTAATANGIYIWNGAAVPMTRALDANTFAELEQAVVSVEEGSSANSTFRQTAVNGVLDNDAVNFSAFGTAASPATTDAAGVIEIATQAEVDAGADSSRAVTPQGLASWSGRARKVAANIGDGAALTFNLDHALNTRDVQVAVYKNSGNYDDVLADVTRPTVNRVTVSFASAPALNAYRIVVSG